MKITFVIASLNAGGAEHVVANLANAFVKQNDDIHIILLKDIRYYYLNESITVHIVSEEKKGINYLLGSAKKIRKILQVINPDVVVSFLTEVNIISILSSIKAPWKLVVSERNNPIIMPKKKAYRVLRKLLYPICNAFVFQTNQARDYFSNSIRKRSRVIHNPVNPVAVCHVPETENAFEIVSVGRLEEQKNFELLIESFSKFHDIYSDSKLTIYGEGSLRNKLEKMIDALSLSNAVSLPGNQKNVIDLIVDKSIFVLSSNYEGMPNALMEAMSVGLPCISTDCPIGGAQELIQDHVNGLLVPVGDSEKLMQALLELYNNFELRKKLGYEARKISHSHSSDEIANVWRQWLHIVCDRR